MQAMPCKDVSSVDGRTSELLNAAHSRNQVFVLPGPSLKESAERKEKVAGISTV